jgi:hypothetical protein
MEDPFKRADRAWYQLAKVAGKNSSNSDVALANRHFTASSITLRLRRLAATTWQQRPEPSLFPGFRFFVPHLAAEVVSSMQPCGDGQRD